MLLLTQQLKSISSLSSLLHWKLILQDNLIRVPVRVRQKTIYKKLSQKIQDQIRSFNIQLNSEDDVIIGNLFNLLLTKKKSLNKDNFTLGIRIIKLEIYCLSFIIGAPPTTPYWKIYCHPRIIKHLITCTFTLIFIDNTGKTGLCYWLLSITLACILTLPNIHVPCTPCLAKKTQGSALYHNLCCVQHISGTSGGCMENYSTPTTEQSPLTVTLPFDHRFEISKYM